jgi:hypothetical protein
MATNDVTKLDDKNDLLKEAADALDRAQKREDATKLAFSMVERGKIPPFESYEAFQIKVASLLEKNLEVLEQALELDVDMPDLGKVASAGGTVAGGDSAVTAFFHTLAD